MAKLLNFPDRTLLVSSGGYTQTGPSRENVTSAYEGNARPVLPPQQFADYELLDEVGRGGMGVVYKARHLTLNRLVALKTSLCAKSDRDGAGRHLQNEAQLLAQLDHPGIVTVHDAGEDAGRPYLCMAFVDGTNLASRIECGAVPAEEAARIVADVAEAVAHAHDRNVIHRDLTPANILLDRAGRPRVADFGLACRIAGEDNVDLVTPGTIVGTPFYMSPEQAAGRTDLVGPSSDVYALGAILYHLLAGCPPFEGTRRREILRQVREDEPRPPREINPSIPDELQAICLRCLRKDGSARYGSAKELARSLRDVLTGLNRSDKPSALGSFAAAPNAHRSWKAFGRRNAFAAGILLLVVAFLALAIGPTNTGAMPPFVLAAPAKTAARAHRPEMGLVRPARCVPTENDRVLGARSKARESLLRHSPTNAHLG